MCWQAGAVCKYQHPDAVGGMLDLVIRHQGLKPDTQFETKADPQSSGRLVKLCACAKPNLQRAAAAQ